MKNSSRIIVYPGVGNSSKVLLRGHYFKNYPVRKVKESQSGFQNLKQAIKRFRLQPHKYKMLRVTIEDHHYPVTTDKHGYFEDLLDFQNNMPGWTRLVVRDPEADRSAEGEYFVPDGLRPSVISDIDDTLLVSHSTRFLKRMNLLLFKNAHTRKATQAAKSNSWTHKLDETPRIDGYFYVSSSEWNLFDLLNDFFRINDLPKGPFFLEKLKSSPIKLLNRESGKHLNKLGDIDFLLHFYPKKQFYLIGDSGQKDVHIYMDIVKRYPSRIGGIFIRKVRHNSGRKVLSEAENLCSIQGIEFHSFSDKELDQISSDQF